MEHTCLYHADSDTALFNYRSLVAGGMGVKPDWMTTASHKENILSGMTASLQSVLDCQACYEAFSKEGK